MRIGSLLLIIFIASVSISKSFCQGLMINEVMADNEATITDVDGDYSDWIELINPTNESINLEGFYLSDNREKPQKWPFPALMIESNATLLIFASGKDRSDELHANFKISAGGEFLVLSDDSGNILDQVAPVTLNEDESWGRLPDGSDNWTIMEASSPGQSNNSKDQLSFSHPPGFHRDPLDLTVSSALGYDIFYTTDGSEPTDKSLPYQGPIPLNYRYGDPNHFASIPTTPAEGILDYKTWKAAPNTIDKAHVLRFASFHDGKLSSEISSGTYLIDTIDNQYTFPVISLITAEGNLFDEQKGIYVPGVHFDPGNPQWTGNYFQRGRDWEKPVHIEYFNSAGQPAFSQDAGMRTHGFKNRHADQKSLRLYARKEYGASHFEHQLLPQKNVNRYKRFLLRTPVGSWNTQSFFKDILAHNLVRNLNVEMQDFQPVIVFLNGEYWGIYNLRDRLDERFIEYTHNIDHEAVELDHPENVHYNNLLNFVRANDLSIGQNYEHLKSLMEIGSYIDYYVAELFFANFDWPWNNVKHWRPKTANGRWRWIFHDLDAGLHIPDANMLERSTLNDPSVQPDSPSATFLFRNLLKNENFVDQFLTRYQEILQTEFAVNKMLEELTSLKALYAPEVEKHMERWGYPESLERWENDIDKVMADFLKKRTCIVEAHIKEYFDLDEFETPCLNLELDENNSDEPFLFGPNPTSGRLLIYNNTSDQTDLTLTIVDTGGKVIGKQRNIRIFSNTSRMTDLSYLKQGIYLIRLQSESFSKEIRIIISK